MKTFAYALTAVAAALTLAACGTSNPGTSAAATQAVPVQQALTVDVFNPGESAIFAVTSVLVEGKRDAVLIDAQFSADQARKLAERIQASGKRLTTIYISHGDPDFYFGLDTLHAAFPDAKILATPQTIAHIQATKDKKVAIWGPKLGANAPKQVIVPQALQGDTLTLEGQTLKVVGLDGPTPARSVVWIPSIRTVAGGIPVMSGLHVWMADTPSAQERADWLAMLDRIQALKPVRVVPGHFTPSAPAGLGAVEFTRSYIRAVNEETPKAANSAELIAAMKQRFPNLGGGASLELSAKVLKGEMSWR